MFSKRYIELNKFINSFIKKPILNHIGIFKEKLN